MNGYYTFALYSSNRRASAFAVAWAPKLRASRATAATQAALDISRDDDGTLSGPLRITFMTYEYGGRGWLSAVSTDYPAGALREAAATLKFLEAP